MKFSNANLKPTDFTFDKDRTAEDEHRQSSSYDGSADVELTSFIDISTTR